MGQLSRELLDLLGLEDRRPPDLYRSAAEVLGAPHASSMRLAFDDLGLAGFLCLEGSPTVAFLVQEAEDREQVDRAHRALWNQGLASLLLVLRRHELLAYSLLRKPIETGDRELRSSDPRLVETLELTARSLEAFELITAVESGRYFGDRRSSFHRGNRVDAVLLSNLLETRKRLIEEGLEPDQARALLIQTTFVAYLEDRSLLDESYFETATDGRVDSLLSLLDLGEPELLGGLFTRLRGDFNGDLFLAPCSFESRDGVESLAYRHLVPLADFRKGLVELETGQGRFWPYDFRYIPVELISALYDRFLAEDSERQRASGAYYTPRPLADLTVDQAWELMTPGSSSLRLLDPACGSGIFLVRAFQRSAEDLRRQRGERELPWSALVTLLEGFHGWDLEPGAVRLAVFALYVALLEEAAPAAVKRRVRDGRLLPRLFGKTLRVRDFFAEEVSTDGFDVVLGNPPWVSRRSEHSASARRWCRDNDLPMPGGEMAWAFLWKSRELVREDGLIALLLPAMGFLLNRAWVAVEARRRWLREVRPERIVNLSDLRFQLFEGAIRPTVLALFRPASEEAGSNVRFDYWCPKADRHLQVTGVIPLPSEDRMELALASVIEDPGVWKRRMWMRSSEAKIHQWLATFPRLGERLASYRESRTRTFAESPKPWIIGQGFQPASRGELADEDFEPKYSEPVARLPHLESRYFRKWVLPEVTAKPFGNAPLRRTGFEDGFDGPHVLLLQGLEQATGRLQAAYTKQSLTFRHSIQALCPRRADRLAPNEMKLLTAVLNSRLTAWFLFHEAANPAAERPKVHERELLQLPFESFEELEERTDRRRAAETIVELVDQLLRERDEVFQQSKVEAAEARIDRLVYRYYGLSENEVAVVEETLDHVVPSVQPRRNHEPPLWRPSREDDWRCYYDTLSRALEEWLVAGTSVGGRIEGDNGDLVVLRLWMRESREEGELIVAAGERQLKAVLKRLRKALHNGGQGSFQFVPDLRVFLDDELFLVKPRAIRYWLRSAALDDADAIAGHLFSEGRHPISKSHE